MLSRRIADDKATLGFTCASTKLSPDASVENTASNPSRLYSTPTLSKPVNLKISFRCALYQNTLMAPLSNRQRAFLMSTYTQCNTLIRERSSPWRGNCKHCRGQACFAIGPQEFDKHKTNPAEFRSKGLSDKRCVTGLGL